MKMSKQVLIGAVLFALCEVSAVTALAQQITARRAHPAPPPRSTESNFRRPIRNSAG